MITEEKKLKLQAYLDGELSGREAQEIAAWIQVDPEGQALSAELRNLQHLLQAGELEIKLPESREFYWSKIDRALQAPSTTRQDSKPSASRVSWWLRFAAPALGAAIMLVGGLMLLRVSEPASSLQYLSEIETPLQDTSAITFHSEAAGMTVVWVTTD